MMFKDSYSVPANTTTTAPCWRKLQICKGTITGWMVYMPEEAADLLQVKIEYHGTQLYPFTRGEWAYGLFEPELIPEEIPIDQPPYELDILAVNTDDTNTHEYNVHVVVSPKTGAEAVPSTSASWFDKLRELFGGG